MIDGDELGEWEGVRPEWDSDFVMEKESVSEKDVDDVNEAEKVSDGDGVKETETLDEGESEIVAESDGDNE